MSYPPTPAPKRLERSRSQRMLGGVAGGLAVYFNMDPTLVRILLVVLTVITGGTPILLYLIALLVMPEEARDGGPPAGRRPSVGQQAPGQPAPYANYNPYATTRPGASVDPVWGPEGAPWEQPAGAPPPDLRTQGPATSAPADPQPWLAPRPAPSPFPAATDPVSGDAASGEPKTPPAQP